MTSLLWKLGLPDSGLPDVSFVWGFWNWHQSIPRHEKHWYSRFQLSVTTCVAWRIRFFFIGVKNALKTMKKGHKTAKNDFFQKSKKMRLPTPEEVLYSKNQVPSSKTVTCRSRTYFLTDWHVTSLPHRTWTRMGPYAYLHVATYTVTYNQTQEEYRGNIGRKQGKRASLLPIASRLPTAIAARFG